MCIIACKPASVSMPDRDTITNMWYSNPNGAGIMYNQGGRVQIEKGFMKLEDFLAAVERIEQVTDLTHCGVVLHFRITTHGGTKPENTHPFPISSNMSALKKLRFTTDVGVAHNGIIHITTRSTDISDTMEYVASQLAPLKAALPRFWENKDAMLLVKNAIQSKMAFLDGAGHIHTIGDFVEHDGILYSNHSYEDYWKTTRYTSMWDWEFKNGKWERTTYTRPYLYDDDYDIPEASIAPHYLMPISEVEGAFYVDDKGNIFEDDGFEVFIDYKGRTWSLDWDVGLAYLDDSIVAVYNAEGMRLPYDSKKTELIDCVDFDDFTFELPHAADTGKKGG